MPTRRLYISSKKASFSYNLNKTLPNVYAMSINSIKIPITYDNIKEGENILKLILYQNNAQTFYNITISAGNYSARDLLSECKRQIDAVIPANTITLSLAETTAKVSINTNDPLIEIEIEPNSFSANLGFTEDANVLKGVVITSNTSVDLLNESIFILLENIHIPAEVDGKQFNVLYKATCNVSPFSIFFDSNDTGLIHNLKNAMYVTNLNFKIVNKKMQEIDFKNSDVEFCLVLRYIENN